MAIGPLWTDRDFGPQVHAPGPRDFPVEKEFKI
jgi:hypothetical protein